MHTIRQKIFFLWFIPTLIFSESTVEQLLENYSQKNDLSQKTIDQNKGHLLLFTRDKLERMHAKTLKDVFKTMAVFSYNENRYAIPDPLSTGSLEPYRSNFIRIYIDGVEITQGWVGSGLFLYGDINIDFVDHIEFYDVTPSFETILEPAYMTIFLYSKEAPKKAGGELNLAQGSRGFSSKTVNYGHKTKDYSYMMNFAHTNAQREKINNGTDKALVRDFKQTQLFSYIKTENQIAHVQIMKKNAHNLGGPSLDATPLMSTSDYLNIHIDYGINFLEHWNIKLAYDWFRGEYRFEDDFAFLGFDSLPTQSIYGVQKNSTYTAEINYKNIFGKHHIHTGLKIRSKVLDASPIPMRDIGNTPLDFTKETFYAFYAQDQYHIDDNQLFTYGLQYSHIKRNGLVENNDLLQLRLGYIINHELWSYKTYIFRSMFTIAPSTRELVLNNPSIKPKIVRGITQEVSYKSNKHDLRLIFSFLQDKDNFSVNMHNTSETNYS